MANAVAGPPIGGLIRQLRHRRALSQQGLADKLADISGNTAVTRRQIGRWERGNRIPSRYWRNWIGIALDVPTPSLDRAAALAQFLRAVPESADYLRKSDDQDVARQ